MRHISFFLQDIDRQINEFVDHKKMRSLPVANQAKEHLIMFRRVVRKKNIYQVEESDLVDFKRFLWDHYPSNYMVGRAVKSANQFLRFFRCDVKIKENRG